MSPLLRSAQAGLCLFFCSMASGAGEPAQVIGVNHFGHIVANLDDSFAFYKDLLQLDVAIPPRPFDPNPAIMKMGNTIGAQSRIGVFNVPGAGFGLELIEYKDIDRKHADTARTVWNIGRDVGGHRHLWRHLLYRRPSHTRNWNSYGTRSRTSRGTDSGPARRARPARLGIGRGFHGRVDADSFPIPHAL